MIIKAFEEQAAKYADKPAIVTEQKKLTYKALNHYANRVARRILKPIETVTAPTEEKKDNPIVGLLFEHGADMIVGVLGTLKAEKAYLPLDVTYPEARLIYMLENSECRTVLTNDTNLPLARKLSEEVSSPLEIVNIDTIDNSISPENTRRSPAEDRLAYILYTSGSTGKPKGVMQDHRNVWYYVRNWIRDFSITPSDRMTLFSSFSHDGAGQDMFGALLSGATLYPFNILNRSNIAHLANWLTDEKITIWHSVHTLFRYFVNTLGDENSGKFPLLRFILLGGEAIRHHDIHIFQRFFPHSTLVNVYGQTESSVSTTWHIKPGDTVQQMLIGNPLDKTKILIIDDHDEIVEDLGVGEIVVNCRHIALGYWKNPEATEKVFHDDPELGRLYFTGDLGRLMAGGSIEFLGRKDSQVKIRGFRVEVEEIESRLLNHKDIKEAVVIAREDQHQILHLCAYIVLQCAEPGSGETVSPSFTISKMREYLSTELPEYMIPPHLVILEKFPLTPSGKVDRKRLPEPEHLRPTLEVTYIEPGTSLEKELSAIWGDVLKLDKVGIDDNFFDLGGTSFDILNVMRKIYEVFKKDIPVVTLFRYPTIRSFAAFLAKEETGGGAAARSIRGRGGRKQRQKAGDHRIAVVGMACRFPGSDNIDEYWDNLVNARETITFFPPERLKESGIDDALINNPSYIRARGVVEKVEYFDAAFFNYSPKEAQIMDPQLRLLHECTWDALENAGYDPDTYNGLIGLFAGNAPTFYWLSLIYLSRFSMADLGFLQNNYTTVVSYKLNLKGPSVVVQSACSTSLVAVHLGCQALIDHECDIALAGGVSVGLPDKSGYYYEEGMMFSKDGHCRPFDAGATGTIFCDGVGVVALKRLEDALEQGDNIYALVLGSGVNNDGRRKVGLASPSVEGQAELIGRVLEDTGIEPESISYVETHGTGTILGDPIELEALRLAFNTEKKHYCRIGSVKSNIGHLNTAAGVAGFIKTVLAMRHRLLPANLHFETPNPKFDFENSPFIVNKELTEWKPNGGPLRAAVSAFGIGGTNAHAILEEPPAAEESSPSRTVQMLLLSAVSAPALEALSRNMAVYFKENPASNLADVSYTLNLGRKACKLRKMILCGSVAEAIRHLETPPEQLTLETGLVQTVGGDSGNIPIVFMFPGQGSQYVNMGLDLYREEPDFALEMETCFDILKPLMGYDIKRILYPSLVSSAPAAAQDKEINQTEITQPVIFSISYSMARLLIRWGIQPFAMMGHSIGEYVAACLAGVFSLEDALKLVVLRGRLMQGMPAGAMLSVPLPERELTPILREANDGTTEHISLAAVNSTSHCVVSGTFEAVEAFEALLKKKKGDIQSRRLHTSHAYHSAMMDPILDEFTRTVEGVTLSKPLMPYISNVTGKWISVEQARDPRYWAEHIRKTVRFGDGLALVLKEANVTFLEVGPGRALSTFVRQHQDKKTEQLILNTIRHPEENIPDTYYLLSKLGRLWLNGKKIDWKGFYFHERRRRLPLPTYPFQRQYYWMQGNPAKMSSGEFPGLRSAGLEKRPNIADWFYIPSWKRYPLPGLSNLRHTGATFAAGREAQNWLIFMDNSGIGAALAEKLKTLGHGVTVVKPGTGFARTGEHEYTLDPCQGKEYGLLLGECRAGQTGQKELDHIVHLWNLDSETGAMDQVNLQVRVNRDLELGFYSLVYLAQAIGNQSLANDMRLTVITDRMQAVWGDDIASPQKAAIAGPVLTIPREYPNIACRGIDIIPPPHGTPAGEKLIEQLLKEILSGSEDVFVAIRENLRWVKSVEPYPLEKPAAETPRLKEGGVYLITGGLGGIGLVLARHLARQVKAKLVLTGRTPMPPREEWDLWLETHDESDRTTQKIEKVRELEGLGSHVMIIDADVADEPRMKAGIEQAEKQLGTINGVIHSAGIADGALIQLRTPEMSQQVMASKITGTLVLDALLGNRPLDFFILCSSTSAVTGPLGQVAYCAANNFMDNFAHYKTSKDNLFTVSVNWAAWEEVGMAVETARQISGASGETGTIGTAAKTGVKTVPVEIPFFKKCEMREGGRVVYTLKFRASECWFLDEHRITGMATLPGTAYLEIARAAFTHYSRNINTDGDKIVELSDFYSLLPLVVREDEEKEMRIIFKREEDTGETYTLSIISRLKPGEDRWLEHVRGKAAAIPAIKPNLPTLEEILRKCSEKELIFKNEDVNSVPVAITFGPRWNNLRRAKYGARQVLASLELPPEFAGDAETWKLHPALLDVGNHILKRVEREITGETPAPYVPISYKRLVIREDMPPTVLFHVTHAGENKSNAESLSYNVTIMDEQGKVLVEIEEYAVKMVKAETLHAPRFDNLGTGSVSFEAHENLAHPVAFFTGETGDKKAAKPDSSVGGELLKDAILPREGVDVFDRVLGGEGYSQLVVSPTDLLVKLRSLKQIKSSDTQDAAQDNQTQGVRHSRPNISTPYTAPQIKEEKIITEIWQEQLGIEQVGINDDFFELGGDSLKAITVTGKIHKAVQKEIPLAEFFNRPTVKLQAEYISGAGKKLEYQAINPGEEKEYYPLSPAQERIYVLYRVDPDNTAYNLTQGMVYENDIDREFANLVLNRFIERHESLRTSFMLLEGRAVQKINPRAEYQLEYFDLEKEGRTAEDILRNFVRPFDLEKAPLIRVTLVKTGEKKYMMLVDTHHIIADAHSLLVILRQDFQALMENRGLPPLRLQYRDYTLWKSQQAKTGIIEKQEAFWLEEFKDGVTELHLPYDYDEYERTGVTGISGVSGVSGIHHNAGDWLTFYLEPALLKGFKELLAEENATLFMGLMALYNILLWRLSGQEDIIIGTPTSGRLHPDLLPIMGMFVNMIVLRNFPSTGKTFREFLGELKQRSIKAFENQDYQFEDLVDKLAIPREPGKNPIFNVSFTSQNMAGSPLFETTPQQGEVIDVKTGASKFDLGLEVMERGDSLYCKFEYKTRLFKAETIERFATYLKEILATVISNRDIPLMEIELTHDLLEPVVCIPEMEFKL